MRPKAPNYRGMGRLQNETQSKNRTTIAQITSMREEVGEITVQTLSGHAEYTLEIPFGGFSIDGFASAWLRGMPKVRDYVRMSFSQDGTPHIEGYTTLANFSKQKAPNQPDGYAHLRKISNEQPTGFGGIFRNLKGGEYDCRSTGGAGWYMDRFGQATIEAGDQTLRINKKRRETIVESDHLDLRAGGTRVRLGNVKRQLAAVKPSAPASATPISREWDLTVAADLLPPLPAYTYYEEQAGDLYTSLGAPRIGLGGPLRYRRLTYDTTGLIASTALSIDVLGNVDFIQLPTAAAGTLATLTGLVLNATSPLGVAVTALTGPMTLTSTLPMALTSTATTTVTGTTALSLLGAQVNVGGPSGLPFALAGVQLQTLVQAIAGAIALVATSPAQGAAAVAVVEAALNVYYTTPGGISLIAKGV